MNPNEASANKTYNITGNTTTQLTGKLVLIAIVINTKGSGSNTAEIYNSGSTTENKIGKLDTTANVGRIEYDIPMLNGIRIVTSTGTAGDLTVIYAETP